MDEKISQVREIIKQIYEQISKFEAIYPGRKFTPDGHMVGTIGEVWAAYLYDLDLLANSAKGHDAEEKQQNRRKVQIKTTQRDKIYISEGPPEHLIVLKLSHDGRIEEIFNGPGKVAWEKRGKKGKNGQYQIKFSALVDLMNKVPPEARLMKVSS